MKMLNLGHHAKIHCFMPHLFIYGTLLFPEILEGLTGISPVTKPAELQGYRRFKLIGCDYPAIIPDPNSSVEGKLVINVDQQSMDIITFFEGEDYQKSNVLIRAGNEEIPATAFTWIGDFDRLKPEDWNKKQFEQYSLPYYAAKIIPEAIKAFYADGCN